MGSEQTTDTTEEMDRLDGWKEIAGYARVSVRTAQRLAVDLGLPVYRIGGKVRATRAAIDAWETRLANPDATPGGAALRLVAAAG